MKHNIMDEYDIVVIGAGHAGCEAGLASARMGKKTLLLSINLESVAMMACIGRCSAPWCARPPSVGRHSIA